MWNRLTAEWNAALEDLRQLESRQAQTVPTPALTLAEVKELEEIATRLDLLWGRLANEDKKRIIRLLVRRVIYRARDEIYGELTIEWEVDPPTIQLFVPTGNVRRFVKALFEAGQTPEDIATTLNAQRVRPLTTARVRVFDAKTVRKLLRTNFRIRVDPPGEAAIATILALSKQGLGQTAIAQELARRGIQNRCRRPYTSDAAVAAGSESSPSSRRPQGT